MAQTDVIIIGAGLAGLCCARELVHHGLSVLVLEASNAPGGRIRTDQHEGFLLDRAFQVFLTSYPEAQKTLDYPSLQLQEFDSGALVFSRGKFRKIGDPFRDPLSVFSTIFSGVGTTLDKVKVAKFRSQVLSSSLETILERPEMKSLQRLKQLGFSERMLEEFLLPFFRGVFFERELSTSSRKLDFCFRMFALGAAALPTDGMEAIPRQIADRLPFKSVRCGVRVSAIEEGTVTLESGEQLHAPIVVIATDPENAAKLEGRGDPQPWHGIYCLYYAAPQSPLGEPLLVLNGTAQGIVNNLSVLTDIASSYGPRDQSLISVTVLPDRIDRSAGLELRVLEELDGWFGNQVRAWRHLRTYRVQNALPIQDSPSFSSTPRAVMIEEWLYRCGDYMEVASIQGAMSSGRRAAEEILAKHA